MKNSFKLITILGIPVEVNPSWFIIFGLIVFSLSAGYFPVAAPTLTATAHWVMGLIAALLLFVCLLLHELSHSLVARANRLPISGITLFVFGGVAHLEKEPATPEVELKMAAAGPAMSIALGIMFILLSYVLKFSPFISAITEYLSFLNFAVAIFNLIPGFPLDGGRIFRALLWKWSKDLRRATYIASLVGRSFAYLLIGLGFVNLFYRNILSGVWLIFLGLFLQEAANNSYRQLIMKRVLGRSKVKNLMSPDVITVPADLDLESLAQKYFFKYRYSSFPVVEDDTILGLITFHEIKHLPRDKWSTLTARQSLIPLNSEMLVSEDDNLYEALAKVAGNGIGRLLVVKDSKLIGILSQRDIFKLFEFKNGVDLP